MINFLELFNGSSMSEKNAEVKGSITKDGRLKGYFCSQTVFSLRKNFLTESEIRLLEKGLDFALIQKTVN